MSEASEVASEMWIEAGRPESWGPEEFARAAAGERRKAFEREIAAPGYFTEGEASEVASEEWIKAGRPASWGPEEFARAAAREQLKAARRQLGITMSVTGVNELASSFETLSARAHKHVIVHVLAGAVSRFNKAITANIPVGPRGHEGDTGGWRNAQSRIRPSKMPTRGRHVTTVAAALPEEHELGIRSGDDYYPFDVEYGSRITAAFAPIRRAVNALEKSVFGEILDLMGHGLSSLAIPIGVGLLLRKAIFGRAIPVEFMPIEWSRARPGDSL